MAPQHDDFPFYLNNAASSTTLVDETSSVKREPESAVPFETRKRLKVQIDSSPSDSRPRAVSGHLPTPYPVRLELSGFHTTLEELTIASTELNMLMQRSLARVLERAKHELIESLAESRQEDCA